MELHLRLTFLQCLLYLGIQIDRLAGTRQLLTDVHKILLPFSDESS